jgi:rfaE bifunctional protein nucleotidyltransferase chain/domain
MLSLLLIDRNTNNLHMNAKELLEDKIFAREALAARVEEWRSSGKKIVFTNGCFDLLHAGHLAYLSEAASLGGVLIVGLNSDESVQQLKGPNRPVNNEATRAAMLASMFFIDGVVLFSEDTPLELIKEIKPDLLVKGGDYEIHQIAGATETIANGGEVKVLDFLPGYSSSSIIEKIKNG